MTLNTNQSIDLLILTAPWFLNSLFLIFIKQLRNEKNIFLCITVTTDNNNVIQNLHTVSFKFEKRSVNLDDDDDDEVQWQISHKYQDKNMSMRFYCEPC